MNLRTPVIALFLFLTVNMTFPPSGPGEFVGHWSGMADGQVAFSLDIELVEGNDLAVTMNAPDQGMVGVKSEWTEVSGDHDIQISFELPDGQDLLIAAELNDEGGMIGTYEMGDQAGTFSANKIEKME
jgi:hypothetical protein